MGFDPSIVSQIGRFLVRVEVSRSIRSPFVGFVSVLDKSFVKRSSKLTVRSRKTVRFWEQAMSADKYPSIFLPYMEAVVYLLPR